jgi:hypothetical protein
MPNSRESERAIKINPNRGDTVDETALFDLPQKAQRGAHRPDGMRARRPDADFEELEEAGIHAL